MTRGVKSTVLNETKYGLQFVFLSKGKRVVGAIKTLCTTRAYIVYRMDGYIGVTVRKRLINSQ